jgi:hypothetical protein
LGLVEARRTHPGRQARRWLAFLGVCVALSALAAAPAHAITLTIDGSPLNVSADDTGLLQVTFDGSAVGEFLARPNSVAYAGLSAALTVSATNGNLTAYGALAGNQFQATTTQPPILTGSGVDGDPFVVTSNYDAISAQQPVIHVTGRVSYVNGSPDVTVSYTVTNVRPDGGVIAAVRLFEAADLVVAGNDSGTGVLVPGPPREVGAVHPLLLGSDRLVEITPWSHFQEATLSVIQNAVSNPLQSVQGMADSIDPARVDTAAGAQWNFANLSPGVPVVVSARWRFTRTSPLVLVAATPTQAVGQTATVNVTARNADGSADGGRSVRYSITGTNPSTGAVTTAANGTAAISWIGTKLGMDTLTAFVDRDGNGTRDVNSEPQQTATVTWTPPPPPVPGKSVVVKVVSGQVLIKRPASGRARQATGPAKGFVPFTGAANIPVGSQLDTRKGRVALTSAADTGGAKTQSSDFYQGIFQVKQALPKKKPKKPTALTTDLVMKGQIARSQCAPLKGVRAAVEAATTKKKKGPKAVLGKLWGNGKGKFRTNGKYSAATVRGTIWLVEDRCEGTFTKVTRGVVQVRDFKRNKTVTVKAGHSYLARAQRAASKAKRR